MIQIYRRLASCRSSVQASCVSLPRTRQCLAPNVGRAACRYSTIPHQSTFPVPSHLQQTFVYIPCSANLDILLGGHTRSRPYVSRAHPRPVPTFNVNDAVDMVLDGTEERRGKRLARWERNAPKRGEKAAALKAAQGEGDERPTVEEEGPYRNQDETIEIVVQLGLDPRKPNQTLRGSVALPHGTGKPVRVAVFTSDDRAKQEATDAGAALVGGDELIEAIKDGTTVITDYDRAVASQEMVSRLGKIARILGPRGLMPNPKLGTVSPPEDLARTVKRQMSGLLNYRLDRNGNFHAPIGKASFGKEKILDHVKTVMNEIIDKKPEGAKGTYLLQVHITATQGKGIKLDLKSVDPGSAFFMKPPEDKDKQAAA